MFIFLYVIVAIFMAAKFLDVIARECDLDLRGDPLDFLAGGYFALLVGALWPIVITFWLAWQLIRRSPEVDDD